MPRTPISLIDTRKRKLDSIDSSSSISYRPSSESTVNMQRTQHVDLGAILQPTNIPKDKYNKIQGILNDRERTIAERREEIETRCNQIHSLKLELGEANARIDRDESRINGANRQIADLKSQVDKAKAKLQQDTLAARELRERKQHFKDREAELTQTMDLGRKYLADKTRQASQLERDNDKLRATVGARDETISSLNMQVLRISNASVDEAAKMAMETQAQLSLGLVTGMRSEIEERDNSIEEYKRINQERTQDVTKVNREANAKIKELDRKLAAKDMVLQETVKNADEARAITQDQAKFIKRLMDENARLGAGQKP